MKKYSPLQYIYIALANAYGYDKMLFEDRIKWGVDNVNRLDGLAQTAESKYMFIKAMNALSDARLGIATGYYCTLDGTASGLQILSCLIGCVKSATRVNLVDDGLRHDVYNEMAQAMTELSGEYIDKETLKKPVMTEFGHLVRNYFD